MIFWFFLITLIRLKIWIKSDSRKIKKTFISMKFFKILNLPLFTNKNIIIIILKKKF